jgi:hypothetical protein
VTSSLYRFAEFIIVSCTAFGDEVNWWEKVKIDPLSAARGLWQHTNR